MAIWISASIIFAVIATHFAIGMPWSITGVLIGLAPAFFKKDKGKVTCDERGRFIYIKATLAGFVAAFLITGLACVLPLFIMGTDAMIPVGWLPGIFLAATLTFFFFQCVAILVQYGREPKGEKL